MQVSGDSPYMYVGICYLPPLSSTLGAFLGAYSGVPAGGLVGPALRVPRLQVSGDSPYMYVGICYEGSATSESYTPQVRTTTSQKYAAVPRRARIQGS